MIKQYRYIKQNGKELAEKRHTRVKPSASTTGIGDQRDEIILD